MPLGSTMFLMGPITQMKKMFEKGRIIATLVYIAAMFLTLFAAIKVQDSQWPPALRRLEGHQFFRHSD